MSKAKVSGSVRERLLEAANDLFYNDGVHTVGIDRVLDRAGVAKASLYSTFGSKEELVREYLRGRGEQLRERIDRRLARVDGPRERVLAVFDSLSERVAEGGYFGCPFIRASSEGAPGPNAAREVSAHHRAWRRDLFTRLVAEVGVPDPLEMSRQLSLLYDGAVTGASMDGDAEAPRVARRTAERLLDAALVDAERTRSPAKPASARKARAK